MTLSAYAIAPLIVPTHHLMTSLSKHTVHPCDALCKEHGIEHILHHHEDAGIFGATPAMIFVPKNCAQSRVHSPTRRDVCHVILTGCCVDRVQIARHILMKEGWKIPLT